MDDEKTPPNDQGATETVPSESLPPNHIGPYKILQKLGEGGQSLPTSVRALQHDDGQVVVPRSVADESFDGRHQPRAGRLRGLAGQVRDEPM